MEVGGSRLVAMCIEAAAATKESVEIWRRQRRSLERLPPQLADALLRRLLLRRLLYPSLLEIFQYSVEEIDLSGRSGVDAEWMAYLGAFRFLRSLSLADCRSINNHALWPLSGMDSLKELDLSRCSKISNAGILHLLSISKLEKLYVSQTGLNADGVKLLSSLRNLRVLDLGGIPVTDIALRSLQVLTQLEHLDIWGSEVSDSGADVLKMFPRLSFLNVAWSNVTKLPNLPSITCLNMSNCTITSLGSSDCIVKAPLVKLLAEGATFSDVDEAFSNVDISHISFLDMSGTLTKNFNFLDNMKALEHLDLSFSRITDDLIGHVASVGANLRYLNLSNTKITSQGMCDLVGNVMNLESLLLSHTAIDDVALSYVGMMTSLKVIDLSHTHIRGFSYLSGDASDKTFSLNALQNIHHLESLNLEDNQLSDEALHPLVSLRELQFLYLKSDLLSDISLHAIQSLQKLKFLGLRSAVVTNSGLVSYRPPPVLCLLDLRGCWLLTADIISLFCSNHPGVEVKHEPTWENATDHNAGFGPSPSSKTNRLSPVKQKGLKSSKTPNRFPKLAFVDERIKYSREELFELQQHSPFVLPENFRREKESVYLPPHLG